MARAPMRLTRRQALRAALRGAAVLGAVPSLAACAVGPPLTVGSQLTQVPSLLEEYNKTNPPARVKAVPAPANLVAGQPPLPKELPDIVDVTVQNLWVGAVGVDKVGPFLRPLDAEVPPAVWKVLLPEAVASFRLVGHLWAVPYSLAHGALAYNDGLVVPARFTPPATAMDLRELQAVLRTAAPNLPPGTVGIDVTSVGPPVWGTVVVGYGGSLFAGGRFAFADGPGLPALELLGAICRSYGGVGAFASGRALFSFAFGSAGAASFQKANGVPLGLLPFPRLPRPRSPVLALGAGVTTRCRDVPGAAAFLAWLASPAAQRLLDAYGAPPARADLQGDTAWVPPLPPGDDADVAQAAPGELLPQVFWHPAILFVLTQAQVAAFSPGAGSTVAEVFRTAEAACDRVLQALRLPAS
jgi:ABC-type glycerol-3-phosphate transport system substrate-binding protein